MSDIRGKIINWLVEQRAECDSGDTNREVVQVTIKSIAEFDVFDLGIGSKVENSVKCD